MTSRGVLGDVRNVLGDVCLKSGNVPKGVSSVPKGVPNVPKDVLVRHVAVLLVPTGLRARVCVGACVGVCVFIIIIKMKQRIITMIRMIITTI